jgi:hypothetical protein
MKARKRKEGERERRGRMSKRKFSGRKIHLIYVKYPVEKKGRKYVGNVSTVVLPSLVAVVGRYQYANTAPSVPDLWKLNPGDLLCVLI